MKWLPINSPPLLFVVAALAMINNDSHYVDGAGYSNDHSGNGIDNNGNSGSANYRFEYGVDDGSSGQFGHEEERNGHVTSGSYRVLLPDGRLQVVTYRADQNGYTADVTYEDSGSNGGYNNAAGSNSGSGGYGQETPATSYGPPSQQNYNQDSNGFQGKGSSRNFVKLRRTVDGKMFNYAY